MLGIDIVDLTDIRSKDRTERSLRLITSNKDQTIKHPKLFWLLWAAKEAIYKCRREEIDFSPTSIPVEINMNEEGDLFFQSKELEGLLQIEKHYVLAVCANKLSEIDYQVLKRSQNVTSMNLRNEIVTYFNKKNKLVEIGSDALNLPVLLPSNEPISISHHNHLGAFAYSRSILK